MPTENDKPAAPAAVVPDPRDAEITSLKKQVDDLEKKLKAKAAPPAGDYCVLKGKTYDVVGTVSCKNATEEGRRNNIDLEAELVILKR